MSNPVILKTEMRKKAVYIYWFKISSLAVSLFEILVSEQLD